MFSYNYYFLRIYNCFCDNVDSPAPDSITDFSDMTTQAMQLYETSSTNQTNGFNQHTDRGFSIPVSFPYLSTIWQPDVWHTYRVN